MREEQYDNLRLAIQNNGMTQSILIWGASYKSDEITDKMIGWGFSVVGYIDRRHEELGAYKGYPVYSPQYLLENKSFVYVALQGTYQEVIEALQLSGYQEYIDYWYPGKKVELDGTENYHDMYGNCLCTENENPLQIRISGGGEIKLFGNLSANTRIISEGCSMIAIGKNVRLGNGAVIFATNGTICIGERCKFGNNTVLRASSGGNMSIGSRVTADKDCVINASLNGNVSIGADCMISYSVFIRSGNSHNIIDLETRENLDDNDGRDIVLGQHVWVGMRVTLLNGVSIGAGSVVGANSFVVKKSFPNNCCLAGNPARIIRQHTAWIRDLDSIHSDFEDYIDFIYD